MPPSMATLPPLFCRHCGALTQPVLGSGCGPHVARAACGACGRFIKWLPWALVGGPPKEQQPMVASVNRCVLLGEISKYRGRGALPPQWRPLCQFYAGAACRGRMGGRTLS